MVSPWHGRFRPTSPDHAPKIGRRYASVILDNTKAIVDRADATDLAGPTGTLATWMAEARSW